jgi:H+/Cl- antiporter ClcA
MENSVNFLVVQIFPNVILLKIKTMIFGPPGKPTKLKKVIYLISSTILGLFLSYLAHAFIEINYLNWMDNRGEAVSFYGACALWPPLQIGLWLFGALGGFFLGRFWWRKLYVERFWLKKRPVSR